VGGRGGHGGTRTTPRAEVEAPSALAVQQGGGGSGTAVLLPLSSIGQYFNNDRFNSVSTVDLHAAEPVSRLAVHQNSIDLCPRVPGCDRPERLTSVGQGVDSVSRQSGVSLPGLRPFRLFLRPVQVSLTLANFITRAPMGPRVVLPSHKGVCVTRRDANFPSPWLCTT